MDLSGTVVVLATDSSIDLERTVRRLRRQQPEERDITVVTDRSVRVSASLARHVQVIRHRTAEAARQEVAALVARGARTVTSGPATVARSTIGACYIVKDEEEVLEASLRAVLPFVDEVVVYDTGSCDRTVEIARACGATVIEGFWDDHFGRARERAMAHLTTEWMFTVDADEVVDGDPAELKRRMAEETNDVVMVSVISTSWSGADDGHAMVSPRISRRTRVRWEGALHEHLVPHTGAPPLTAGAAPLDVRLVHSGYQVSVVSEKDKPMRNLQIARAAWAVACEDQPGYHEVLANYGRSLHMASRSDEAVTVMDPLRTLEGEAKLVLTPGRVCTEILIDAGRADEASAWVDALERNAESGRAVALYRARIALVRGDLPQAQRHVDRATAQQWSGRGDGDADPWGLRFNRADALAVSAWISLAEAQPVKALALLHEQMLADPARTNFAQLLTALERSDVAWEDTVRAAPRIFLDGSLRTVVKTEPAASALRWCRAFLDVWPEDRGPLVAGCLIAAQCDLGTALTWSVMARQAGLPELCPLRRRAEQDVQASADRALLWALLADSFGEEEALTGFHATVAEMPDEEVPRLTAAMSDLTPDLAHALFGAPSTS